MSNRVVPAEERLPTAPETAGLICGNSPGGVQLTRRALQANQEVTSYAAACELENRGQALLITCSDAGTRTTAGPSPPATPPAAARVRTMISRRV